MEEGRKTRHYYDRERFLESVGAGIVSEWES